MAAQLWAPKGVALDGQGNLYIADTFNQLIREVTRDGFIYAIAGVSGDFFTGSFGGDGGPATAAHLNNPSAVAVDSQGNLFIADSGNQRIRKVVLASVR